MNYQMPGNKAEIDFALVFRLKPRDELIHLLRVVVKAFSQESNLAGYSCVVGYKELLWQV